jgi:lipoprotein NlpD
LGLFVSKNIILAITLCVLVLSACTSRYSPAPVSNISTFTEAGQRNKYKIKSSKYTVKKGDTLYSIAWRANSQVQNIAQLNNISPPYKIYPEQTLFLLKPPSKKTKQVNSRKVSIKKTSKKPPLKAQKSSKNTLASSKKQAYGNSKVVQKISQEGKQPSTKFSKKVSQWLWPVKGKVIEYFSSSDQGNKGIDLAGSRGTKIKASAQGKVVYAGNALRGYGKLIIIKHNDDYLSAYAHNDQILVKEQQLINGGDYIATMGDTDANKVMLHFEIRFRGKSVNPMKYLPKK